MQQKMSSEKVRLNIQISAEVKSQLLKAAALQGKKVSVMVRESIVNLSQIRTIDKKRLVTPPLTVLSDDVMRQVGEALKNSLALG